MSGLKQIILKAVPLNRIEIFWFWGSLRANQYFFWVAPVRGDHHSALARSAQVQKTWFCGGMPKYAEYNSPEEIWEAHNENQYNPHHSK